MRVLLCSSGELHPPSMIGSIWVALLAFTINLSSPAKTIVAWGWDEYGQTTPPWHLQGIDSISSGDVHTICRLTDGSIRAWGGGPQAIVPANLGSSVAQVSAGAYHSLARRFDGSVAAWGDNQWGQCSVPAAATAVVDISGGGEHSLAVRADGMVMAWGAGADASGNPNFGQSIVPAGTTGVVQVAAGGEHSIALRVNGSVTGWGRNDYQQASTKNLGLLDVRQVAAGEFHNLALRADGTVVAWGAGKSTVVTTWPHLGQSRVPQGLSGVSAVAAAMRGCHSIALKSDGTVVLWGSDAYGQLSGPVGVAGVSRISAGGYHTAIVVDWTCLSDVDGSASVDPGDLGALLLNFGLCGTELRGDVDDGGCVDSGDLALVLLDFGNCWP